MQYARKLRKGDKVAIVSLSSGMLGEEFCSHNIEIGVKRLKEYGLEPVFMPNLLITDQTLFVIWEKLQMKCYHIPKGHLRVIWRVMNLMKLYPVILGMKKEKIFQEPQ